MSPPIASSIPNNVFSAPDSLTGASDVGSDIRSRSGTNQSGTAGDIASNAMVAGTGAMSGRMIAVSSGSVRTEVKQQAAETRNFLSGVGRVLSGVVRSVRTFGVVVAGAISVVLFPLTLSLAALASRYHSSTLVPRADHAFRLANADMLGSLEHVEATSLAANQKISEKLVAHAKGQGN